MFRSIITNLELFKLRFNALARKGKIHTYERVSKVFYFIGYQIKEDKPL